VEKDVGDRLRELRERRGLKQSDLAAKLGVHVMTVTLWEDKKARRKISTKYIQKIAEALNIQVSELLGEEGTLEQTTRDPLPIMTQSSAEVQLLRMFRLMSEKLQLWQLAQFIECVNGGQPSYAPGHEPSIDSAAMQSTILGFGR
jgi:transcriptional regulator with XRE-family HTH domain